LEGYFGEGFFGEGFGGLDLKARHGLCRARIFPIE
jgi:hypothetical protein